MTLTTRVAIFGHRDDIRPTEIYEFARALVRTPDEAPVNTDFAVPTPGVSYINTSPATGAQAYVIVRHADGAPLPARELDDHGLDGDWSVIVSFDTGYGYVTPDGRATGALHRDLVTAVMTWADDRGHDAMWRDDHHREWSSAIPTTV